MTRVNNIIKQLQDKREEGELITTLFPNINESDNSINQIAHRVREKLGGKDRLITKNGIWKLQEYAYTITMAEMNQNEILSKLNKLNKKVNRYMTIIMATVIIISVLITLGLFNFEY